MSASFDVIVCGSLHLDIVLEAPTLPRIDETVVGHGWKKICGGKGGNQAMQAARAGAKTAMIGRVGADDFGDTLCKNLKAEKVDVSAVTTDLTLGSGMSAAILQDDGDYGAVIVSGANTTIDSASLSQRWQALGGAKVLVLQNEIPHAANVAAAAAAHRAATIVVFNAAPVRELHRDLLENVDVLVVNRIEAEAICGKPVQSRADARNAMPALITKVRSIIITLGGEGLVVADERGNISEIEPVMVKVTSTHGAGDCFVGVLAAKLAKGATLIEACHFANQHAAEFVSRQI